MSDNTSSDAPQAPGAYPATQPPAPAVPPYAAQQQPYPSPPAYSAPPQYPAPQQYGDPAYGSAAPYPYVQEKTNTLAVVSLIASLVGIIGILPFIGSITGVITGHIALRQLKTSGEKGRGMALAGTIVGWVGLGFVILGVIAVIIWFAILAGASTRYGT